MTKQRVERQAGFTIVELMIATLVFTVILLVITTAVLRFSAAYYRSVRTTATQETARSIIDTLSRAVELGSGTVTSGSSFAPPSGYKPVNVSYICAGGKVFAYQMGPAYDPATTVGLTMSDNTTSGCTFNSATEWRAMPNAQQLLPKNMRLVELSLEDGEGGLKKLSVVTASSDLDLLCRQDGLGNCDALADDAAVAGAPQDLVCVSGKGSEYCAVSKLNTVVGKRLR